MISLALCGIDTTSCTTWTYIRTSRGAAICADEERCLLSTASLEVAVGRDIRCRSCMRAVEDIGGGGRKYEIYKGDLRLYNCAMNTQLAILDAERITRWRPPSCPFNLNLT